MQKPDERLPTLAAIRNELAKRYALHVVSVFDSFEKSGGTKDVSLCEAPSDERVILRIGEFCPGGVMREGYVGSFLRIPRHLRHDTDPVPHEIEEFVSGRIAYEANADAPGQGTISPELLDTLLRAFWEFQDIGRLAELDPKPVSEKVVKHFESAAALLSDPDAVSEIINGHERFWDGGYPSKWKFALNNLIIDERGRVVFIDNANAGLRCFGYDLGWIIWPRWVEMNTAAYGHPERQLAYLASMRERWIALKPESADVPPDWADAFWLIVFERIIGALFDIENDTRHLAEWNLDAVEGSGERRERHVGFLRALLKSVMRLI